MILGFLLAVCYDPYILGAATAPRWALLAVALPALIAFRPPSQFTLLHLLGLLFIAWCGVSLAWTANLWDGLGKLITFLLMAEAFVLGARSETLRPVIAGLACGLTISSLIVMTPLREIFPSPYVSIAAEGLFGNRNMLAEAAALTAVGCIGYRLWWLLPGLTPALFGLASGSSISRGAMLGLIAAAFSYFWGKSKFLCVFGFGATAFAAWELIADNYRMQSVHDRLALWHETISNVTFFGHGLGSFFTLFPYYTMTWDTALVRPEHPHNEILSVLFELGFIGTAIFVGLGVASLWQADQRHRAILAVLFTISMVTFPFNIPTSAFIGAVVIGHVAGGGNSLRGLIDGLRVALRARYGTGANRCRLAALAHGGRA